MVTEYMHHILTMRLFLRISATIGLGLCWSLSYAGSMGDGRSSIGPAFSSVTAPSSAVMVTEVATGQGPSASVPGESVVFLRTVPSLSKQISVGGTKLMPYIGAGFGGGYVTEFDRSLHASPSFSSSSGSTNAGLRSLFGPHLIPNEVQLGIRVPF
jgi:hypothetical protein